MSTIALYATDTMADWEYAYVTAGIAMAEQGAPGRFRLAVASDGPAERVVTQGGLAVVPTATLADLDLGDLALLILPGADTWWEGHDGALDLAARCLASGVPVAAICGATYGAARAGFLDERDHTSNAPDFLAGAPGYRGADRYREERTVADGGLITAPATAPVDFARAIFAELELFPPAVIEAWHGLYTTGERRYYEALVQGEA